ncbi:lytic transglycosylase domain-containing protein [Thalassospiraceae bacterium LMO-JJ14]|nr:lytic transglycosylase domain-containing protein [Thalassospiraceae bacterium LMO-JJ14]
MSESLRSLFSLLLICILTVPGAVSADVLTAAEAREFSAALKEVERGSKARLDVHARRLHDPLARKIVSWYVLFQGGFGTDFEAIDAFINRNPDWPRGNRLLARAEEAMDANADPAYVIGWFGDRSPVSTAGREKLANAIIRSGDVKRGVAMIRDIWIHENFAKSHEKSFYRKFRKHLTLGDNRARADRLMWDGRYWPARRMIYRVDAQYRKLIEARTSLRRMKGNVDLLVSHIPKSLQNDAGLVYERMRWRRKKGLESAYDLLRSLPEGMPYPNRWWDERAIMARQLLQKGFITEAYRVAAQHGLTEQHAADHAEAEFLAGWIALRFLNEPKQAREHFQRLYDAVNYPVSLSRGAYWLARAIEQDGDKETAKTWYAKAAQFPTAYYGQLATAKVNPGQGLRLPPDPSVDADVRKRFDENELVRAVRMLAAAGEEERLFSLIMHIASLEDTVDWHILTARLARLSGRPDLAIRVTKKTLQNHGHFVAGGYPTLVPPRLPKKVKAETPETPLILAIVRQESEYDTEAISHAGARGLMQLMPATARTVAKRAGLRYSKVKLTTDPDYNLTLGQSYIAELIDDYKGYLPMAIAAYNAGPHRVRQWVKQNGDPRDGDVDAIDWVELIPFTETRNYVQRVLENVQVYRMQLAGTEVALSLEEDLRK